MDMARKGHAMTTTAILVVLLLIMDSASVAFARAHVEIWNDMRGETLVVECDTKRTQFLLFGQTFKWGFTQLVDQEQVCV